MERLEDKNREYKRFRYSAKEKLYLASLGCRTTLSSNVSAVCRLPEYPDDLILRFVNGSVYRYPNQIDRYDDIFNSISKGKWVWDNLRGRVKGQHKVPYQKLGNIPLPSDINVSDEEVFDRVEGIGIDIATNILFLETVFDTIAVLR